MAENRPGGEPTEPPSEKKLRDARLRGEVAKSKEVISMVVFIAVAGVMAWSWPQMIARLRGLLHSTFSSAASLAISPTAALDIGLETLLATCAPILLAAMLGGLIANFAQVGALFTLKPLKPQLGRLSPLKNAKQIFGKQAVFELLKSILKVAGIGYLAYTVLWDFAPRILGILGQPPEQALTVVADCLGSLALRIGILAVVLAVADVLYQRHSFIKKQRMTKEEVKREHKESEGDPQHKADRQRLHREISEHQALENVAFADCVVINPTHIAVALKYNEDEMEAPTVVASGKRLMASKIREIARQHGVPIVRNVPLARALVELDIDQQIPAELFEAVAEVLRFVYKLSGKEV